MTTKWVWTDHIRWQMLERKISKELVETALNNPDKTIPGKWNRIIYQKILGSKLIRVTTEKDRLITVYLTDKIEKYMKGEGK